MLTKSILLLFAASLFACAKPYDGETAAIDNRAKETSSDLESIPLELTSDKGFQETFIEGDEIQWLMSLGSDAFIYMYHIDALNNITQLLPADNQESHFYTAGYFLTVPEYQDTYRFIVSEPFGSETIWLIASDESITMNQPGALLGKSPGDSIETIKNRIKKASRRAYGESSFSLSTKKRYQKKPQ